MIFIIEEQEVNRPQMIVQGQNHYPFIGSAFFSAVG